MLPLRPFGTTGLTVTALGFGAMQVGAPEFPEEEAARVLHGALDLGLRVIDTARAYGDSEARIGRHLARRRDEFVLSTKVGYGVDGVPDWTYACVVRGIEAARARLRTDVIDVVHLHSCPLETLRHGGVVDALAEAVQAGRVRVAAYSGENEALDHVVAGTDRATSVGALGTERATSAVAWGTARATGAAAFGAVQLSVNVCESRAESRARAARERGLGVLAKRPFAGHPWRSATAPGDPPHAEYWRRFASVRAAFVDRAKPGGGSDVALPASAAGCAGDGAGLPRRVSAAEWTDLALRASAFADGVDACLVGGTSLEHLRANVESIARGPLAEADARVLRELHARVGDGWPGVI